MMTNLFDTYIELEVKFANEERERLKKIEAEREKLRKLDVERQKLAIEQEQEKRLTIQQERETQAHQIEEVYSRLELNERNLFSLPSFLYEMLTGKTSFSGPSPLQNAGTKAL